MTVGSFAQNESTKWYFGAQAGLNFLTNPPSILTNGAMTAVEGCASVADAAGNPLFYTDGVTVWNRNNLVMVNGTGLSGEPLSTQSCIIIKQPGSSTIYYIFTIAVWNAMAYTVVDMSLANGDGAVVSLNNPLIGPNASDKITATLHCNGTDIWVVSREAHEQSLTSIDFYAYLVTSAGVNTVPVMSPANFIPGNNLGPGPIDHGAMKISPNGKKLGLAIALPWFNVSPNTPPNAFSYELYDFNTTTGAITNFLGLDPWNTAESQAIYSYGCEFSPDGTKFYGSSDNGVAIANIPGIQQWDLCAGSNTAIAASMYVVATASANINNSSPNYYSMQLAPNGKIYVARWVRNYLSVINSPNLAGAACNFSMNGQSVAPNTSLFGLPNLMTSYFFQPQPQPPFTYTINPAISCLTASFTVPNTSVACAAANYSVSGISWLFGDPGSGAANTSTLLTPVHAYPAPGNYRVKLVFNYACGSDTLTQMVSVPGVNLNISTSGISCASLGSATVNGQGGTGPYS